MLQQSRQRRLQITQQVDRVCGRERISSVERRKRVESQLNQYVKTMHQFHTKRDDSNSPKKQQEESPRRQQFQEVYVPTMKNIQGRNEKEQERNLRREFYEEAEESAKKESEIEIGVESQLKERQEENYSFELNNHINEAGKQITSQQSNDKAIPSKPQSLNTDPPTLNLSPISESPTIPGQFLPLLQEPKPQAQNQLRLSSHCSEIADQQIKMPAMQNQSLSNNSQAIFFTSQFQQYITKMPQLISPDQPKQPHQAGIDHNTSGRSLAVSNQESLKYSLNQSALQHLNVRQEEEGKTAAVDKDVLNNLFTRLAPKIAISILVAFCSQFDNVRLLTRKLQISRQQYFFTCLLARQQYALYLRRNQLTTTNFHKKHQKQLLKAIFIAWKQDTQQPQSIAAIHLNQKQTRLRNNIFTAIKMMVYDRRIIGQVDLYYLSKIFSRFKETLNKMQKKNNQKAAKAYISNLRKRFFRLLLEGVAMSRLQVQQTELADEHYRYNQLRRSFIGWRQLVPHQEKFVKICLITRSVQKQTKDNRVLLTKTVDFKQIQ